MLRKSTSVIGLVPTERVGLLLAGGGAAWISAEAGLGSSALQALALPASAMGGLPGSVIVASAVALTLTVAWVGLSRLALWPSRLTDHGEDRPRAEDRGVLLAEAVASMSVGVLVVDAGGRVVSINRRAVELLGLPDGIVDDPPRYAEIVAMLEDAGEFVDGRRPGDAALHDYIRHSDHRQPIDVYERLRPNGVAIEVRTAPLPRGGFVRMIADITDRRRSDAHIRRLATRDGLTGVANRSVLLKEIEAAARSVATAGPFALHAIDLDRFKAVNDTHGHPTGDKLLIEVAKRLTRSVRGSDLVARVGGDEFAVLQLSLDGAPAAKALAERVCEALSAPYEIDGKRIEIGASIGIALCPEAGDTPQELMKAADVALYEVKGAGRGAALCFEPRMAAAAVARRALERDLRSAVRRRGLELHYQPIITLADRSLVGFEALMRWREPGRGLVSPAEFIPVAEELGLIVELGAWALEQACADVVSHPASPRVAVNLSAVQFRDGGLVDVVKQTLRKTGLEASRLELEITESILLADGPAVRQQLHALRDLGVRIAMDDFGTGYSSLSYLLSFPFDRIKIDRAFVHGLATQPSSHAIVRCVTDLARRLQMTTTAEGVETEDQLDMLTVHGCTEAQGYFLGRPGPADEVLAVRASP